MIQIIGMPGSSRDGELTRQLGLLGLQFMRELGVRPNPNEIISSDWNIAVVGTQALEGEVGCRKAHFLCAKRLLESKAKYSIVFEDDARLLPDFSISVIEEFIERSDAPSIILLGTKFRKLKKAKSPSVKTCIVPPSYSFGYAINRDAARILVEAANQNGLQGNADWPPELVAGAVFFRTTPSMAAVDVEAASTISRVSVKTYGLRSRLESLANGLRSNSFNKVAVLKILILRSVLLRFKLLR